MKNHFFVTAPHTSTSNWHYTTVAFKEVLVLFFLEFDLRVSPLQKIGDR